MRTAYSFVLFFSWTCQFSYLIVLCACLVPRSPSFVRGWWIVGILRIKSRWCFSYVQSIEIVRGKPLHNTIEYFNTSKYFCGIFPMIYVSVLSCILNMIMMTWSHFEPFSLNLTFSPWPIRSPAIITSGRKGESTDNGTILLMFLSNTELPVSMLIKKYIC